MQACGACIGIFWSLVQWLPATAVTIMQAPHGWTVRSLPEADFGHFEGSPLTRQTVRRHSLDAVAHTLVWRVRRRGDVAMQALAIVTWSGGLCVEPWGSDWLIPGLPTISNCVTGCDQLLCHRHVLVSSRSSFFERRIVVTGKTI